MNLNIKLKAVTLVEAIIYLAVFGVLFLIVVQFMFSISEANSRSSLRNEIDRNVLFLTNHFQDNFAEATSINASLSQFANDNGVLRLTDNGEYYEYRLNSGRVQFNRNGVQNYLTMANIDINQLRFDRVEYLDGSLTGARVTITLSSEEMPEVSRTYTTAFILNY
ncbi:MAG: hypothetical protein QY330_00610 [Candidatus Dojkabacteria bacterium]|uniref:Uncharacterized protein n=2 Tax=Candidatus Dojkabacteria TaxID=74243 RepID=A0A136KH13_9BACT|nr:MAG: hypothetical protein UZ20_WS6002000714 [candidate division WS6 bacterium OLB21]MBW7953686.1 hypothetical protein [Candidatus Dojkabacteria bacterium]WKZ28096.1 MAG: hypothetical protein QY330_00610 [Candidatus Dojkabacteria bacterium]